jgi:predicted enzyme related to lactoylglutathione lyase
MPDRDGYIAGVPCWTDTSQPDPEAALGFYADVFGWEFHNAMPPEGSYHFARLRGRDVAAVGSLPEGAPPVASWNTYIWVDSADDAAADAREAGGTVVTEPFDLPDAGRMAVLADPEGATFCVWQARAHKGARIVNEHGAVNFNGLHVRDVEGAKAFYGAVFGWTTLELPGLNAWTLPGYGDHLEESDPNLRERTAELGGPVGFEDVVASINPIPEDDSGTPAHWSVTFGIDDADAAAEAAVKAGGTVSVPPFDAPWVRMTVLRDPAGATFTASQFVPENKDLGAEAGATANA